MNPSVKLEIDPGLIVRLNPKNPFRVGGVRLKTTIYVVTTPEITGINPPMTKVQMVVVAPNDAVELRVVE